MDGHAKRAKAKSIGRTHGRSAEAREFSIFDSSASDFKLGHYLFFDICVNGVHFCWRYPLLALST